MNEERDKWDEAIQAKLFDHEVEPMPEDWAAIANRLPKREPVAFRYWSAAAAAVLALVVGGGIYLFEPDPAVVRLADETRSMGTDTPAAPAAAPSVPPISAATTPSVTSWVTQANPSR